MQVQRTEHSKQRRDFIIKSIFQEALTLTSIHVQVTLEENTVLEALIACEPEPLSALEEAGLPARFRLQPLEPIKY